MRPTVTWSYWSVFIPSESRDTLRTSSWEVWGKCWRNLAIMVLDSQSGPVEQSLLSYLPNRAFHIPKKCQIWAASWLMCSPRGLMSILLSKHLFSMWYNEFCGIWPGSPKLSQITHKGILWLCVNSKLWLMPNTVRVNRMIECLSHDAIQAPSTHHRVNKCTGAAVNPKENSQTDVPKGIYYFLFSTCNILRVQG